MVYIDSEYRCHTSNPDGTFRAVEHPFFADKCTMLVEGYRYIPSGESWTREDGVVFYGEMITPWKPYDELEAVQREYERQKLADAENALVILLGGAV